MDSEIWPESWSPHPWIVHWLLIECSVEEFSNYYWNAVPQHRPLCLKSREKVGGKSQGAPSHDFSQLAEQTVAMLLTESVRKSMCKISLASIPRENQSMISQVFLGLPYKLLELLSISSSFCFLRCPPRHSNLLTSWDYEFCFSTSEDCKPKIRLDLWRWAFFSRLLGDQYGLRRGAAGSGKWEEVMKIDFSAGSRRPGNVLTGKC